MKRKTFHLGICTSGGDCPGLNSVIRAVTKHAIGNFGMMVTGIRGGISGLMTKKPEVFPLTIESIADVEAKAGTILGTSNKGSPFRKEEEASAALSAVEKSWSHIGLDGLIVVGGDGSQRIAHRLSQNGYKLLGIPKTIDNDVWGTETSIGFSSAIDLAVDAASRLKSSAEAHDRIMVLEVMGRNAGHIALHTALATGAHAVLIPEIPFDFEELVNRIKRRTTLGRSSYLVIAAEGAYPIGSQQLMKSAPSGTAILGGIGDLVGRELHQRTGIDARVTVLGHLQRGGTPNPTDRILGAMLGKKAVDFAASNNWGFVLGIMKGEYVEIPYEKMSGMRRTVDLEGDILKTVEALGTTLGRASDYEEPI